MNGFNWCRRKGILRSKAEMQVINPALAKGSLTKMLQQAPFRFFTRF
ncbi:hypothetical protein FLA_5753 [Filimonas lacunae]|nr:hypothetical protein FLA_5753 [Filimonas lacunae]